MGPPFLEAGITKLDMKLPNRWCFPAIRPSATLQAGRSFRLASPPNKDGSTTDLRIHPQPNVRGRHLSRRRPGKRVRIVRSVPSADARFIRLSVEARRFSLISLWKKIAAGRFRVERNAVTRGVEFGVSPFAEGRRAMVERGSLLGSPPIAGSARGKRDGSLHRVRAYS